jgi:hypothetical protein
MHFIVRRCKTVLKRYLWRFALNAANQYAFYLHSLLRGLAGPAN